MFVRVRPKYTEVYRSPDFNPQTGPFSCFTGGSSRLPRLATPLENRRLKTEEPAVLLRMLHNPEPGRSRTLSTVHGVLEWLRQYRGQKPPRLV